MSTEFIRRALRKSVLPAIIATGLFGGVAATTGSASAGIITEPSLNTSAHGQFPIPADAAPPIPVAVDLPKPPPPAPLPVVPATPPPSAPVADPFSAAHSNWVMVPSVGVSVGVGSYTDCTGGSPVPHGIAARDWCAPASTVYLLGHNPGVFTPMPGVRPGALVRYWDASGNATTYAVRSVTQRSRQDDSEANVPGPPHLDFQTCANADGSIVWIIIAYPV